MINLIKVKNQKLNLSRIVEVLFYTFPLSFIIGNLALSLHSIIFIIVSLILIKEKKIKHKYNNYYWILVLFFLYVILCTYIQFQTPGYLSKTIENWPLKSNPIFKSFLLIRYLILFCVLDILISNKILHFKKFFLSSLICTSFVSVDVILQYFAGYDLFGYESNGVKNSGPFGEEWIAGSYLQKFSFFSFFFIFQISKNKKFNQKLLIFVITITSLGLLLAGNRVPFYLYLLGFFIITILIKKIRFAALISLTLLALIFSLITKNDPKIFNYNLSSFLYVINFIQPSGYFVKDIEKQKYAEKHSVEEKDQANKNEKIRVVEKKSDFLKRTGHGSIYKTSIVMWKEQPVFGYGLKSFRIKCWEILPRYLIASSEGRKPEMSCATHSHNYYLELLSEVGLLGGSLMFVFFIILFRRSIYLIKKYRKEKNLNLILIIPVIMVIFIEIWPIRSTGSFFTTWNATFFWIVAAMLLSKKANKII